MILGAPHYEIESAIGEGGMGRVYRAVHRPSGVPVAIKTLRHELASPQARRLLLREAAAAARLDHPRIVKLLDITRDEDGRPALVMELVHGEDVSRWLARWPGFSAILPVLLDTLEGLSIAHGAGVVHRDLKPENLLIEEGRAKITDFGVAEVLDPLSTDRHVARAVGTPIYMAPEQLDPDLDIGPWTDLYAFGVVLFEILYEAPPHSADHVADLLRMKRSRQLPAIAPRRGLEVPDAMRRLLERLLDPEPRRRMRFAKEAQRALESAATGVVEREVVSAVAASGQATRRVSFDLPKIVVGLPNAETVDAASAETLFDAGPTEAPRLSTVRPRTSSNLPAPPTPETAASVMRLRRPELVGRREERRVLAEALAEVADRRGTRLVGVIGAAGAGKSALARWALAAAERRGDMEGVAAGYDLSGTALTGGLDHAVRRLVGSPAAVGDGPAWAWLRDDAGGLGFDEREMTSFVSASHGGALSPERIAALAEAAIAAVCRVRPVYLWLDDVGWSRDGGLDLVERLLDREDALDVAIVVTLRSGTAQHLGVRERLEALFARDRASLLELGPLSTSEKRTLLDSVVKLERPLSARFAECLDDMPLMLLTRIYAWIDAGHLVAAEDGYDLAEGVDTDDLFSEHAVEEALGERLESFFASFADRAEAARRTLITTALVGVAFEERVLVAACADWSSAEEVRAVVDRAVLAGLFRSEARTDELRFDHGILRELLESAAEAHPDRSQLLRGAAGALAEIYEHTRPGAGERVAALLARAGASREAATALVAVAEAQNRTGVLDTSAAALRWARKLLDESGAEEGDVLRAKVDLADAERAFFAMDYAEAERILRATRRVFESGAHTELRIEAMNIESGLHFYQDHFRAAEKIAVEMERMSAPGSGMRHRAIHRQLQISSLLGDQKALTRHCAEALRHARLSGERWRYRTAHIACAECDLLAGRVERARRRLDAVDADAQKVGDVFALGEVGDIRFWLLALDEEWEELARRTAARLEVLASNRDSWRTTMARSYAALAGAGLRREPEEIGRLVEAHLDAVAAAPNDEPTTRYATRRLAVELEAAGHADLAVRVHATFDARMAQLQISFGEGVRIFEPLTSYPR